MNPYLPPGFRADVATHVVAISAPQRPGWKWRLVNAVGEPLMESQGSYPTIAAAVAEGQRRMPNRAGAARKEVSGRSRSGGASK
jgi:hypothetical protein